MSESNFRFNLLVDTVGKPDGLDLITKAEEKRVTASDQANEALKKREPILQHLLAEEQKLSAAAEATAEKQHKFSERSLRDLEDFKAKAQEARASLPPMSDKDFEAALAPSLAEAKRKLAARDAAQEQLLASTPDWARAKRSEMVADPSLLAGLHQAGNAFSADHNEPQDQGGTGSVRDQASGILGTRKDTRIVDRLLGLANNPEMAAQMSLEAGLDAMGAKLPVIIGAVGSLALAWKVVKTGLGEVITETPHLKDEIGNLGDTFKERLGDVAKGVLGGDGDGLLSLVRDLTEAWGGETEEMKRSRGPMLDYIGLAEKRKTILQQLQIAEHNAAVESDAHRRALGELAAALQHVQDLSFDEELESAKLDQAEEIKKINADVSASEEQKALRIADANDRLFGKEIEISQKRRALKLQEKEWALEETQTQAQRAQENKDEIDRQITAVDKLTLAKTKAQNAELSARRAANLLKGRTGEDFEYFDQGGEHKHHDAEYARDKAQADKLQAYAEQAKAAEATARKALVPGADTDPQRLKEAQEKAIEAKKAKDEELEKQRAELDREKADEQRKQEREQTLRDRKLQTAKDEATGEGRVGALQDGKNADQLKAEKLATSTPKAPSQHAPSDGSSSAASSTQASSVGTMHVGTLQVQNASGLGGGNGSGSGGGHGDANTAHHDDGGHGQKAIHPASAKGQHFNSSDVKSALKKYAEDRLKWDIAQATKGGNSDQSAERQEELNKAQIDHFKRIAGLDDATERHMADGDEPMHSKFVSGDANKTFHSKYQGPGAHKDSSGGNWSGQLWSGPSEGQKHGVDHKVGLSGIHFKESEGDLDNAAVKDREMRSGQGGMRGGISAHGSALRPEVKGPGGAGRTGTAEELQHSREEFALSQVEAEAGLKGEKDLSDDELMRRLLEKMTDVLDHLEDAGKKVKDAATDHSDTMKFASGTFAAMHHQVANNTNAAKTMAGHIARNQLFMAGGPLV